ncbi:MAG TPA: transcriptional regulator, partial [Gammaproteobacteria bacterium]|nr:transcriptional regulator [Gammaproteobacteria bacterium]
RNDFRHFRTDRILALQCLDEIIPCSDEDLLQRWRARR